jgi:ComF family protein
MKRHGRAALAGADCVVPVPLHWRRRWSRGFNQAGALADGLGLPVVPALGRSRHTRPQADLPAGHRQANVRGAFRLTHPLPGAVVVLIDDVSTTGATLEACAKVLKSGGVREVRTLTAARAVTRRHDGRPP